MKSIGTKSNKNEKKLNKTNKNVKSKLATSKRMLPNMQSKEEREFLR